MRGYALHAEEMRERENKIDCKHPVDWQRGDASAVETSYSEVLEAQARNGIDFRACIQSTGAGQLLNFACK